MAKQPHISHEDALIKGFRKNLALVTEYLNTVLEAGDQKEVATALRRSEGILPIPIVIREPEL